MVTPFSASSLGWMTFKNVWAAVAVFHGCMLLALLIHRNRWDSKQVFRGGRLFWMPLITLSVAIFGYSFLQFVTRHDRYESFLAKQWHLFGLDSPFIPFLAVYFCLVNPVLEEAFWRGLFGSKLRRPTISDIAYGSFHYWIVLPFAKNEQAIVAAAALIVMGYLWRQIATHSGGLRLPIFWHALADAAIILVLAFP